MNANRLYLNTFCIIEFPEALVFTKAGKNVTSPRHQLQLIFRDTMLVFETNRVKLNAGMMLKLRLMIARAKVWAISLKYGTGTRNSPPIHTRLVSRGLTW